MKKTPIRILHVIGSLNIGGAETFLINLYRNIDRTQIQFDFVVSSNSKCYFDEEIESLGGKIHKCPKYYIYNYFKYKNWWKKFFSIHKEYKIVHGHIGSSAPVYLKEAKNNGILTIAHSHATKSNYYSVRNIIWKINSYQTRFIADYFMACSLQAGIDRFGESVVNSEKFSLLKCGIDTTKFYYDKEKGKAIRNELQINSKYVIGSIGRLEKEKNYSFLIDVFNEYHKKNDNSLLMIVGDGSLKQELKEKIDKYDLESWTIY